MNLSLNENIKSGSGKSNVIELGFCRKNNACFVSEMGCVEISAEVMKKRRILIAMETPRLHVAADLNAS